MAEPTLPDRIYLCECFIYDPVVGTLTWRQRPRHHFLTLRGQRISLRYAGTLAGAVPSNKTGYLRVNISGNVYQSHRVIWKMVKGEEYETIDHWDLDRTNNRWGNLRPSLYGQNNANSKVRSNSKTGIKGVQMDPRTGRYKARIRKDKITRFLGSFDTTAEAHAAYCKAARELHGEFWNPG